MSIQSNFPAIAPTLNLSFALTKALDPRISFSRASTATYYGTQTAKAEENLLLQSQDFATTWSVARTTVTANTVAAPDGTTTADTLTNTTATGAHQINQGSLSIVSGLTYTATVFAKKNTNDFFQISGGGTALGSGRANFNLATGVLGSVDAGVTAAITDVGNGWYRCTYTITASSSGTANLYFVIITSSTAAVFESYTGLGTESVYLWGAQLEQRSAATAYTVTTTQTITNYIPVLKTAASGVARFDHKPTTFESLGLLIEEQRTNLLTYSEQFDNAAWTKTRSSITANTIVAPDGTLTGDKLVENTDNNTHLFNRGGITISANTTHTLSIFLKKGERDKFSFSFYNNTVTQQYAGEVDLAAGTITGSALIGTPTGSASIQSVGNGWYRATISVLLDAVSTTAVVQFNLEDASGNTSYTGNGYSGIYIWGAQLEAGAFPTSYIPTVASQVTRAADAASMTGTNFSSWYSQGQGTLYIENEGQLSTTTAWSASITDAANTEIATIRNFSNTARFGVQGVASGSAGATVAGVPYKTAFAFSSGNQGMSVNGATTLSGTTAMTSEASLLRLASNPSGNNVFTTRIRKVAYYPLRVTDAQLQALTS
jgi:hypothetical protein